LFFVEAAMDADDDSRGKHMIREVKENKKTALASVLDRHQNPNRKSQ
jgi:hypothetical protein